VWSGLSSPCELKAEHFCKSLWIGFSPTKVLAVKTLFCSVLAVFKLLRVSSALGNLPVLMFLTREGSELTSGCDRSADTIACVLKKLAAVYP